MQISSKVLDKKGGARGDKLIAPWLRQLAAAAAGHPVTGYLVARDAIVTMAPLDAEPRAPTWPALVALWRQNLDQPLPTACKTALALLRDGDPRADLRRRLRDRPAKSTTCAWRACGPTSPR